MSPPRLSEDELKRTIRVVESCDGNIVRASIALGISRASVHGRLWRARSLGLYPMDGITEEAEEESPDTPNAVNAGALKKALRGGKHELADLARMMKASRGQVIDAIDSLKESGYAVNEGGGRFWLDTKPLSAADKESAHTYTSRDDGSFIFGFTSDNHLGSKYARLDVLNDLFAEFERIGVDRVFNAGNWIDGEASFNKHDLLVHGMHQQVSYLADHWPRIDAKTYAVTGDDHEGWYSQREGVDIGRYAEQAFRDAGRDDWVNLGYMEADIRLVHAKSGAINKLRVAHPGGGSAYATSYAPQKYIESLDGGDKPAVVLLGHWHKQELLNIRNVWTLQTGCTQDQTPFARKKRLDFHVGGGICRLVMNPETGAIESCTVEFKRYFNRAHYGSGRWSHHADVTMAERAIA